MFRALRGENGSAIVVAMLVMMLFMSLTFASLQLVDTQQGESRKERERESSFALAEGALNSQIFLLSRQWPGNSTLAYQQACTPATSADPLCPDATTLQKSFNGADYNAGLQWTTEVYDNVSDPLDPTKTSQFYDDVAVRQQLRYDANKDGLVWVRAQSNVRDRRRTVVALIRAERLDTPFPRNVVVANRITVGPSGKQTYIGTTGSYAILRCNGPDGTQLTAAQCKNWSRVEHVGPNGEVRIIPAQKPALSPETVERFRETAKANGTYFPGPCAPTLTGAVVFIENANCGDYDAPGTSEWNTAAQPGVLMVGTGRLGFKGNALYNGVIYMVNGSDGVGPVISGDVVTVQGNTCIRGVVVIDGPGGISVGSSNGSNRCNGNIDFNANAANNLRAFGTAGIVQNSFREISTSN
jgi:hypothetical protein